MSIPAEHFQSLESRFVGRKDELRRFQNELRLLAQDAVRWAEAADETGVDFDPDAMPADTAYARVFILHGIGGIGKTWLSKRCLELAEELDAAPDLLALYVDVSQGITPVSKPQDLLERLYELLVQAGYEEDLRPYREACAGAAELEARAERYNEKNRERWKGIVEGVSGLAAKGLQFGVTSQGLPFDEGAAKAAQAVIGEGIHAGAAGLAQARDALAQRMVADKEMTLAEALRYRDPLAAQASALSSALQRIAARRPLALALDTLEVIVPLEPFLQQGLVLPTQRAPILWLLAGRHNLADERRVDNTGQPQIHKGYRDLLVENAPVVWDMSVFSDADLQAYLEGLRERGRLRLEVDEALLQALKRTSGGVPLAVEISTDALCNLGRSGFLRDFALDDTALLPAERISAITARFLRYCMAEPGDLERIQALALLLPGADEHALRALWALPPAQRPGQALADLRSRYAFLRPEGLHDAVRDFIRRELLAVGACAEVRATLAERAVAHYRGLWEREHAVPGDPVERTREPRWQGATRALLNALWWRDPDAAVAFLLPRVIEGLGFDLDLARELVAQAGEFLAPENCLPLRRADAARLRRVQAGLAVVGRYHPDLGRLDAPDAATGDMIRALLALPQLEPLHHAILQFWQGRMLSSAKRYPEALASYDKARAALPDESPELRAQLGRAFYELSSRFLWPEGARTSRASKPGLQAAQQAVDCSPEYGSTWYNLGVALAAVGDKHKALAAFEKANEIEVHAMHYNGLGNALSDLGRHAEAIEAYRKAAELDAALAYPWNGLGNVYHTQGRHAEAIEAYRKAAELDAALAYPWNGLGNVFRDLGQLQDAESAYRKAIQIDQESASGWHGLGHTLSEQGVLEESEEAFRKALETEPQIARHWRCLGNLLLVQQRISEANAAIQKAIELDPNFVEAHISMASILALSDPISAQGYLEPLLLIHPGNSDLIQAINILRFASGPEEMDEVARQTVLESISGKLAAVTPTQLKLWESMLKSLGLNMGIHTYMATILELQGRRDEAKNAYDRAVQINAGDYEAWDGLGNALSALGRHAEAIEAYQKALELDSQNPYVHNNLGDVYMQLGELEKAQEEFQERVRLSPTDALGAYVGLGILAELQNHAQKAQEYWSKALEVWDNAWRMKLLSPAGLFENRAQALLGRGDLDAALKTLQEALDHLLPGDSIDFYLYLLWAQAANPPAGLGEMLSLLRQALCRDPDRHLLKSDTYNRACLEALAGNAEAAMDYLEQALAQAPGLRAWATRDPDLITLREHPRFRALTA